MAKRTRFIKPPVCKPCWELHYCPYGVLVESMPFCDSPEDKKRHKESGWKETQSQMYERAKRDLTGTKPSDDNELWNNMFFVMFADPEKKKAVQQYNPRRQLHDLRPHLPGVRALLSERHRNAGDATGHPEHSPRHHVQGRAPRRLPLPEVSQSGPRRPDGIRPHHSAREGRSDDGGEHSPTVSDL
jgi:hypothetical protein